MMATQGPVRPAATRLTELTRDEVRRRAPEAIAVIPVGACEQHGPHLPLGTDLLVVDHIAGEVSVALCDELDVILAPSVAVGYSPHHVPIGPTLTAGEDTLLAQLREMCDGLVRSGFRRIFLLNGHGGNAELVVVVARSVGQKHRVRAGAGSYWVMAWDRLMESGAQERGRMPGHAGSFETSLMLALRPDLVVDPPRRSFEYTPSPPGYFGHYHVEDVKIWERSDGFSDDPSGADAASGRRFLDCIVSGVTERLREFAVG